MRNLASARALLLRNQRRRRVHWHIKQTLRYVVNGPYRLASLHAWAGEVLARDLGELGPTITCMLNRGRAYRCLGRDLDSITVMAAAIRLLASDNVRLTQQLREDFVELCYRVSAESAQRGCMGDSDKYFALAETALARLQRSETDPKTILWHQANVYWVHGIRSRFKENLEDSEHFYGLADDLLGKLELDQNVARIKYERASIVLDQAANYLESGKPEDAAHAFTHADRLLDECAARLGNHDWGTVRAMLILVRRKLHVMREGALQEPIDDLLAIADIAHAHNDRFARSFALTQACRELVALGKADEAITMLALANSINDEIPNALRSHRSILRKELAQLSH